MLSLFLPLQGFFSVCRQNRRRMDRMKGGDHKEEGPLRRKPTCTCCTTTTTTTHARRNCILSFFTQKKIKNKRKKKKSVGKIDIRPPPSIPWRLIISRADVELGGPSRRRLLTLVGCCLIGWARYTSSYKCLCPWCVLTVHSV